jgi:hypothetical protein
LYPLIAQFETDDCTPVVNINGPTSAYAYDQVSFSASISGAAAPFQYQWYTDTGSGFQYRGSGSTLNVTMPGNSAMNVKLVITDGWNRQATDYHYVSLFLDGPCGFPCPMRLAADDQQIGEADIMAYPNPVDNFLELVSKEELVKINLLNLDGTIAKSFQPYEGVNILDIQNLPSGTYYLRVETKVGSETLTVIKR